MCSNCDTCIPITNDCLCKYAPLKGVELDCIHSAVIAALCDIEESIGQSCTEMLCEEIEGTEEEIANSMSSIVRNNETFKFLFSRLIYRHYLCDYAGGVATPNGIVTEGGSFADGKTPASSAQIKIKEAKNEKLIQAQMTKFLKWFKSQDFDCEECEEENITCKKSCNRCGDGCDGGCKKYIETTDFKAI